MDIVNKLDEVRPVGGLDKNMMKEGSEAGKMLAILWFSSVECENVDFLNEYVLDHNVMA